MKQNLLAAGFLWVAFAFVPLASLKGETPAVESAAPAAAVASPQWIKDVDYVGDGNPKHQLDLLLPADRQGKKLPLVVFIHGGSWLGGSRQDGNFMLQALAKAGYAAASISYRFSSEKPWPAQIYDCKAAIRFLRAQAADYQIDPNRIGVAGMSAGGHLVSLLGVSGDVKELEGSLGGHTDMSSRVNCVVNFFGPEDFLTALDQNADHPFYQKGDRNTLEKLFGGPLDKAADAEKQASPVTWVTKESAPFFTAHGTADPIVPFAQAQEIHTALQKAGVESHLIAMKDLGHGFTSDELNVLIMQFLDQHLRDKPAKIPVDLQIEVKWK